ncbi:MAG TPA: DEAD/DEAH box helicase family protein, partial [Candidatus Saccharimonadales bacterium]|nr:DEAD/DEAH box helicase family protein [Candidatus Saccharimonadales bacterium]
MSLERKYQPQLIEETEALLGTPYFTNEAAYSIADYGAEELGLKRFIYQAATRVLAAARREDRALAQLHGQLGPAGQEFIALEWNDQWEPTARKIAEIAFRYQSELHPLSQQLALVNNATEFVQDHWDELRDRLHADQQVYMLDIMTSLQKSPRTVHYTDELGDTIDYIVHGTTIIAPTGFGKTRLIEICAKMFEPGQPLRNSERVQDLVRVVLVSPSVVLLDQTAEELAAALPGVRVGRMHGGKKEPDADIVLSTIESFNNHFEDNKIAGHPVSTVMVDEAHHLAEPQFRHTFVTQWRGPSLVFTATPAYDLERDVRAIIPHVVEKTNILKSIEKGILNDSQIMTFFIDNDIYDMLLKRYNLDPTEIEKHGIIREVIDTLVLEFVTPLLEQGRRGMIFCEQGREAHWANRMAERLGDVQLADGRQVRAQAMHSYGNKQLETMAAFRRGELDVITTVDTGREGLDANFDFVIVNCNIVSRLRGHQIVGRGTRLSEDFPTTVYGQFSYRVLGTQFEKLYSIEEAFGSDTILQTRTIRDRHGYDRPGPSRRVSGPIDLSSFPEIIRDLLDRVDRKPVGEAFVGVNRGRREVVDGLIPLPEIIKGFTATEMRAKKLLRAAGHSWYGRIEEAEEGLGRRLVHHYKPEARDFLHNVLPKGEYLNIEETANVLDMPIAAVRMIIEANNITGRPVSRGVPGRPPICYSPEDREAIIRLARTVPGASKDDRKLADVAQELGIATETVLKLAGVSEEGRPLVGGVRYLTALETEAARNEFRKVPMADSREMSLMRIADTAGIDYQVVSRNMTADDWAAAVLKRYKDSRGFTRLTQIWPADKAVEIAARMERFRARPLDAHVLPSSALRK